MEKPCPNVKKKDKEPCPLGGKFWGICQTEAVVYQALDQDLELFRAQKTIFPRAVGKTFEQHEYKDAS